MSDSARRSEDQVAAAARAPISVVPKRRRGFLPFSTNTFDRVFISVVLAVAIHLLWMRFLEPEPPGLSLYIATAISTVLGLLIVTRG